MADKSIELMTKQELEQKLNQEIFSSYTYTIVGCAAAIPLARHVPPNLRFAPLLVLGAVGSLLDFQAGQKQAEPYKRRLDQLLAQEEAAKIGKQ